jgi:hypothetical protein
MALKYFEVPISTKKFRLRGVVYVVVSSLPAELWVVRSNPARVWGDSFKNKIIDSAMKLRLLRKHFFLLPGKICLVELPIKK